MSNSTIPPLTTSDLFSIDTADIGNILSSTYITSSTYTTTPSQWGNVNIYTAPNTSGTIPAYTFSNAGYQVNPTFNVKGDAEFEGDVKIQGHSILHLLEKLEDRLAILQEPDPKKLEKFAALKKAYDHYKILEKLIGDDKEQE